jgi:hypothetical protein
MPVQCGEQRPFTNQTIFPSQVDTKRVSFPGCHIAGFAGVNQNGIRSSTDDPITKLHNTQLPNFL